MSIDTGLNLSFNTAFPIPGVKQSSQGVRDNFAVIKRAIEYLQDMGTSSDSIFSVTPSQDVNGAMSLSIGYRDNALILPTGNPSVSPLPGMVRYHAGTIQVYNGTDWALVSGGVNLSEIIDALAIDPRLIELIKDGYAPNIPPVSAGIGGKGLMTSEDKSKLDSLSVSFNELTIRSDAAVQTITAESGSSNLSLRFQSPLTANVQGKQITIGVNLPQDVVVANGAPGFMSGADKAKLDKLTVADASTSSRGYMSAADKTKLDTLAKSFTRINVTNGPIIPTAENSAFEIVGQSGINVTAIPGQPKIAISIGSIGGIKAADIAATYAAVNAQRTRNDSPVPDTINEKLTHVSNTNATVDLQFSWDYPSGSQDIDGFRVTVYSSTVNKAYIFGSSTVMEQQYIVPSDRNYFTLPGAAPDKYWTLFVQAYRYVGTDLVPAGILYGLARKSKELGKDPYQPNPNYTIKGNILGTIGGRTIDQIFADIIAAQHGADWSGVSGSGKPKDNADVTSENISKDTLSVGGKPAADLLSSIDIATNNIKKIFSSIDAINNGEGGSALQAYVNAARAAQNAAEASALNVKNQFDSIAATKIVVERDRTTAQAAQIAASSAADAAYASAQTATSKSKDAESAATVTKGYATVAETKSSAAEASAVAAESSNLSASLTVAQTRPSDFDRDGVFWDGYVSAIQGVTYQSTSFGRTYQQSTPGSGNKLAWITPKKPFITVPLRRIRAIARVRYAQDGVDANLQTVDLVPRGIKQDGTYIESSDGVIVSVDGYPTGGVLSAINGWREYAIDFIANSAFTSQFNTFNIHLRWNTTGGTGKIEVLWMRVEDVTESGKAEVAANASITASQAAIVARNESGEFAQVSKDSSIVASTAAGSAQTYTSEAAESARTAESSKNTAIQQAGVATNAAIDSQTYSSAAASHMEAARSEATRAENSSSAVLAAAVEAKSASNDAKILSEAASGYANTASTKASDAASSSEAARVSALQAKTSSEGALSSANAAVVAAETAVTKSTLSEQSAEAARQSELAASAAKEGATGSAEAANIAAASSRANATLTTQYADSAEQSSLSARITNAALMPAVFSEKEKFFGIGALGTAENRTNYPPLGSYPNNVTYGIVFESLADTGSVSTLSAQVLTPNRTYRVSASFRATTNNIKDNGTGKIYVNAEGLNANMDTIVKSIRIGGYDAITFMQGWFTVTKDIVSSDFGASICFRPVVYYNQVGGQQIIQVREIRVEDITLTKGAQDAASASADNLRSVIALKTETSTLASAAQTAVVAAKTAAGEAKNAVTQVAISAQDMNSQVVVAATKAELSATSALSAINAVKQSFPSDFASDGVFYTNQLDSKDPDDVSIGYFVNYTDASFTFRNGNLPSGVTHTRSSAATNYVDGTLTSYGINVARFVPLSVATVKALMVENYSQNLILRSQNLGSTWVATNLMGIPGTSIVENTATNSGHFVSQTVSLEQDTRYTVSVVASETGTGSKRYLCLRINMPQAKYQARFDLGTGEVGFIDSAIGASADISAIGSGRWLCSLTIPAGARADAGVELRIANELRSNNLSYTGDGVSGLMITDVQCEAGMAPTSRIKTTTATAERLPDNVDLSWGMIFNLSDGPITLKYTFSDLSSQTVDTQILNGKTTIPYDLNRNSIFKVEKI